MTTFSLDRPAAGKHPGFDISPLVRVLVATAATAMSLACFYALFRGFAGIAPSHPNARELAVVIHVATVVPAIPLGGYLLLSRKGTALHKLLGRTWVALMVATATSAIFIQSGGGFSWLHIFVPLTLFSAWKTISTARAGKLTDHKQHIVGLYFGALMIPGVFAFALPHRLMNVLVFGW